MKITANSFCKKTLPSLLKDRFKGFLVYGSNYGLSSEIGDKIKDVFLKEKYLLTKISSTESSAKDNAELFIKTVSNTDLFGDSKLIIINSTDVKMNEAVKNAVTNIDNLNGKDAVLLIILDDLDSKSALRKLFESDNNLAIIPCYADTKEMKLDYISSYLKKYDILLNAEQANFIADAIESQDRSNLKNELDKLVLYLGEKNFISLDEIKNIIIGLEEDGIASMVDKFIIKKYTIVLNEINKYNGQDLIKFVNFTLRQMYQIKNMLIKIKSGISSNEAIKHERIFFKRVGVMNLALQLWSLNEVSNTIVKLLNLDMLCKSNLGNIFALQSNISHLLISLMSDDNDG